MEILFIVYHDLKTEARSMEMLKLLKMYGHVTLVSYCDTYPEPDVDVIYNPNQKKSYFHFIKNAAKAIKRIKPQMIMIHDNYPMILVPLIKSIIPKCVIIHDSSELRILSEKQKNASLKARLARFTLYIEKLYAKKADITIAANMERAKIMKDYLGLKEVPLVFDNIHKIEVEYDKEECERKFSKFLKTGVFRILYAGGVDIKRQTYKIAREIGLLGNDYQLIIVGSEEINGRKKLYELIKNERITNVEYLGFISREELKFLIEYSDVTISTFEMDTVNNINCASGKVYEGLFLGKPLLAGINPPLKYLCDNHGIGVSTTDFGKGCLLLKENYSFYQENVKKFIEQIQYDNRIHMLKKQIDTLITK